MQKTENSHNWHLMDTFFRLLDFKTSVAKERSMSHEKQEASEKSRTWAAVFPDFKGHSAVNDHSCVI